MNLSVIFSNIIGFDGIIFIVAVLNAVIFKTARDSVVKLYKAMHRKVYTPACNDDIKNIKSDLNILTDNKVSEMCEKAISKYTLYVNITGIFPLLGILGTVIALLGMVGNTTDINGGFFSALTSTFWGLVFAIIFKFLDGFLSPKLEDAEKSAELFLQRKSENNTIQINNEDEKVLCTVGKK